MKNRSPFMVCCLILLALMLLASLFVTSSSLFGVGIVTFLHDPAGRFGLRMYGIINLLNALGCAAGIVHLLRGRDRKADPGYLCLLLLQVAVCLVNLASISVCLIMLLPGKDSLEVSGIAVALAMAYAAVKAILLLIFLFRKGMGGKKWQTAYAILVLLDVVSSLLFFRAYERSIFALMIVNSVTKLVLTGAVGLALFRGDRERA